MLFPGAEYCGEVLVKDIGITAGGITGRLTDENGTSLVYEMEAQDLASLLPQRSPSANKGTYGKLLLIGGQKGMAGAMVLAGRSALRTGCGLLCIASDPENRVILHCHPANLLAMSFVHSLDEREFTRSLWQMCTECVIVFPDGVNVLPWMVCGTNEIGEATAEKMRTARLVVWAQHGIYGAGRDLDSAFGLIETAEKAAEVYMKIAHLPRLNTITDDMMHRLEARFRFKAREGYLN
jgi:hypothetical protein